MSHDIKVKLLDQLAKLPRYASTSDSGADIYSTEYKIVKPKSLEMISTGISVEIPVGFEIQVRSRSGLAFKNNVFVLNSPGTIDESYRGEIKVLLYNLSDRDFEVNIGDRVAQLVLSNVPKINWVITDNLSESNRNNSGFGSTGTN